MKNKLIILSILLVSSYCSSNEQPAHTNALADESSPYLLQHAHNPVDWYPWKEEALTKAVEEDKLMIISIGYAACHWCHVMEKESFQDTAVAHIMNRHFVSIKVDREERPDVDDVYMTACQIAGGGSCGWPLNAIALPDGRPIWVGTYFPKKQWVEILKYFVEVKNSQADKLEDYAGRLLDGIARTEALEIPLESSSLDKEQIQQIAQTLLGNMDFKEGGSSGQPKFPLPVRFEFLLEYNHLLGDKKAKEAVELGLNKMANGGIYDQLGGGFARYSTDAKWMVPHFEKMLYDNAQLISLYAHAYQINPDPLWEEIIRSSIGFVERALHRPEGGFYASLNADSEGEEGRFYVWTKGEIDQLIPDEVSRRLFSEHFNIQEKGNWEDGKNILAIQQPVKALSQKHALTEKEVNERLRQAKTILFEARKNRVHPSLDDKMLTSWNALMLKGYLDAHRALKKESYRKKAIQTATFLSDHLLQADGRLDRNFKDGQSSINAFLDDYAHTIQAFLELYQQTFDLQWLQKARLMSDYVLEHFKDEASPLFFYTSDQDPPLVSRKKETTDNVIPASNSVMAQNLYRLGLLYDEADLISRSSEMLSLLIPQMATASDPSYFANWGRLYLDQWKPPFEVVVIGEDFAEKRDQLLSHYLPNALILGGTEEKELPLLQNKYREGKTMIYVCQNKVCKLPVEIVEEAIAQMR